MKKPKPEPPATGTCKGCGYSPPVVILAPGADFCAACGKGKPEDFKIGLVEYEMRPEDRSLISRITRFFTGQ